MLSYIHLQYVLLFLATCAFEGAYVAWIHSVQHNSPLRTTCWGVLVSSLSLIGLGGAIKLPYGWVPYLTGVAVGGYVSAYIGKSKL